MTRLKGTFSIASWNEDTYAERGDGAKLTRAAVVQKYSGDIDGDGSAQWLMSYRTDGTARFVGLQEVKGAVDGREGSFMLDSLGEFDGKTARGQLTVIKGSGTDGLAGVAGKGKFDAPMGGGDPTWELTLTLP